MAAGPQTCGSGGPAARLSWAVGVSVTVTAVPRASPNQDKGPKVLRETGPASKDLLGTAGGSKTGLGREGAPEAWTSNVIRPRSGREAVAGLGFESRPSPVHEGFAWRVLWLQ